MSKPCTEPCTERTLAAPPAPAAPPQPLLPFIGRNGRVPVPYELRAQHGNLPLCIGRDGMAAVPYRLASAAICLSKRGFHPYSVRWKVSPIRCHNPQQLGPTPFNTHTPNPLPWTALPRRSGGCVPPKVGVGQEESSASQFRMRKSTGFTLSSGEGKGVGKSRRRWDGEVLSQRNVCAQKIHHSTEVTACVPPQVGQLASRRRWDCFRPAKGWDQNHGRSIEEKARNCQLYQYLSCTARRNLPESTINFIYKFGGNK